MLDAGRPKSSNSRSISPRSQSIGRSRGWLTGVPFDPEIGTCLVIAHLLRTGTRRPAIGRNKFAVERPEPLLHQRSEERRVGKECVSPCSSRWSSYLSKKNTQYNTSTIIYNKQ